MMHGSEGIVRLVVRASRSCRGRRRHAVAVRPRARAAADRRDRASRCAASTACCSPGPTAPYSELSTRARLLLLGSVLAPAAVVRELPRRQRARDTERRRTTRRQVHRRALHRAHPDPAASRPCRPRCCRSSRGLAGDGRARRVPRRHAQARDDRPRRRRHRHDRRLRDRPVVGELLFGKDKFILGNRDLGLLALGSGAFILALTLAQG